MPNRIIYSNEPLNSKVQIFGSDLDKPIESSNGLLMIELSGTPTVLVENTVSVTGSVQIAGTPQVSITETPTVSVGNTVSVTGAVQIAGSPTVIIGSRAFTSILVTAFTLDPILSLARSITTSAIDVSQLSGHSYAVHVGTDGLLAVQVVTPRIQAAPINNDSYFSNTDNGTNITLAVGSDTYNQILTDDNFLQYSRFVLDVAASLNVIGSFGVTVYLQGQY